MGVYRRRGHAVAQKEVKQETRLGVTDSSGACPKGRMCDCSSVSAIESARCAKVRRGKHSRHLPAFVPHARDYGASGAAYDNGWLIVEDVKT